MICSLTLEKLVTGKRNRFTKDCTSGDVSHETLYRSTSNELFIDFGGGNASTPRMRWNRSSQYEETDSPIESQAEKFSDPSTKERARQVGRWAV
jgi:hypothetical protein